MTNLNKTADCIAVPDKVSDAEKLIVNGKDITKDKTAKIICSDPNFLGRSENLPFLSMHSSAMKKLAKWSMT